MRVALIHYWLVTWRGGEQVLRAIADLFPGADLFTHVADPELVREKFPGHALRTTFINRLPAARRWYQRYIGLMPLALEQLDLRGYELVISSEAGPAKGVITDPDAVHLCYCHSPMRYAWDMYHSYLEGTSWLTRAAMVPTIHYLRLWDQASAARVDRFAANSAFVARRIRRIYRRDAEVIHPPVRAGDFGFSTAPGEFFLSVGQLAPYKRIDLLVEAFNRSGERLVVIGEGALLEPLRRIAKPNVQLLGRQPFAVIREHYIRCRALVFPAIEDFGLVPLEAMASGRPVIAYARGGALETVVDGRTGILFAEQSIEGLSAALLRFSAIEHSFDPELIRAHARQFSPQRFAEQFGDFTRRALAER